MSPHEIRDRLVPGSPVRANTADVPPIAVELAVAEAHHFSQGVKCRLEKREESAEPAKDGDGGELHDALGNGREVERQDLVERVLEERRSVLGGGYPDDNAQTCELEQALEHEAPADLACARIDGLVYERWGPPEVAQVIEVDVLGIWAALVELRQRLGLLRVQVCVTKIAIREGVRSALEEDDDGVHLAHGTDAWVVDVVVDGRGRDIQVHRGI